MHRRNARESRGIHQRIVVGMASVAAFVLAAKLVAAAKEMVVAWRYGISGEVDAYLLAITVVTWVPVMVASVGTAVLVPRLVALTPEPRARSRFLAELNGAFALLGLAMMGLSALFGPWIVGLVADGLPAATRELASTAAWQLAPLSLLTVLAGFLAIRLQARERQAYTFLEAMPALGILVFVLLASPGMGMTPLIWGTLSGAVLQVAWSVQMARHADDGLGGMAFSRRSGQWRSLYAAFGVMAMGQLVMGLSTPIDQVFAAQVGEGAVATLGYANRIISLATGLGAIAIARALLPVLSETVANEGFKFGRAQTLSWASLMLGVGFVAALVGWLCAPWGVRLLFERGAFGAQDTDVVAHALRIALFQLPFFFSGVVLVQWIAVLRDYRLLLLVAVLAIAFKAAMNFATVRLLALDGIILSTVGMYAISWICQMLFVLGRKTETSAR